MPRPGLPHRTRWRTEDGIRPERHRQGLERARELANVVDGGQEADGLAGKPYLRDPRQQSSYRRDVERMRNGRVHACSKCTLGLSLTPKFSRFLSHFG